MLATRQPSPFWKLIRHQTLILEKKTDQEILNILKLVEKREIDKLNKLIDQLILEIKAYIHETEDQIVISTYLKNCSNNNITVIRGGLGKLSSLSEKKKRAYLQFSDYYFTTPNGDEKYSSDKYLQFITLKKDETIKLEDHTISNLKEIKDLNVSDSRIVYSISKRSGEKHKVWYGTIETKPIPSSAKSEQYDQ